MSTLEDKLIREGVVQQLLQLLDTKSCQYSAALIYLNVMKKCHQWSECIEEGSEGMSCINL